MKILSNKKWMKQVRKIEDLKIENSKLKHKFYEYRNSLSDDNKFINHLNNRGIKVDDKTRWVMVEGYNIDIPYFDGAITTIRITEKDFTVVDGYPLVKVAYLKLDDGSGRNFVFLKSNY